MEFRGHKSVVRPDGSTDESWFRYRCSHCDTDVAGAVIGYPSEATNVRWLWCTSCGDASVRDVHATVYPGSKPGPAIVGLPENVSDAYREARASLGADAPTGCELVCRKIIMYVAVQKGAPAKDENDRSLPFAAYLQHLKDEGWVTPPMHGWVDLIREHGNEAAHELDPPSRKRAESTLMFTAELLRLVYEMEHYSNEYQAKEKEADAEDAEAAKASTDAES